MAGSRGSGRGFALPRLGCSGVSVGACPRHSGFGADVTAECRTCSQSVAPGSFIFVSKTPLLHLGNLMRFRLEAELCSLVFVKVKIKEENDNLKKSVLCPIRVAFVEIGLFSGRKRKRWSQGRERHGRLPRSQGK